LPDLLNPYSLVDLLLFSSVEPLKPNIIKYFLVKKKREIK